MIHLIALGTGSVPDGLIYRVTNFVRWKLLGVSFILENASGAITRAQIHLTRTFNTPATSLIWSTVGQDQPDATSWVVSCSINAPLMDDALLVDAQQMRLPLPDIIIEDQSCALVVTAQGGGGLTFLRDVLLTLEEL